MAIQSNVAVVVTVPELLLNILNVNPVVVLSCADWCKEGPVVPLIITIGGEENVYPKLTVP